MRYTPKDVQVHSLRAYRREGGQYNLAKPSKLQEHEQLLLRLDTSQYVGEINGVDLEPMGLFRQKRRF